MMDKPNYTPDSITVEELLKLYQEEVKKTSKLLDILQKNQISTEDLLTSSVEEDICLNGIISLSKLFETGSFTKEDALIFDILHKNLRLIRNLNVGDAKDKKRKSTPEEISNLISIVKNGSKK